MYDVNEPPFHRIKQIILINPQQKEMLIDKNDQVYTITTNEYLASHQDYPCLKGPVKFFKEKNKQINK